MKVSRTVRTTNPFIALIPQFKNFSSTKGTVVAIWDEMRLQWQCVALLLEFESIGQNEHWFKFDSGFDLQIQSQSRTEWALFVHSLGRANSLSRRVPVPGHRCLFIDACLTESCAAKKHWQQSDIGPINFSTVWRMARLGPSGPSGPTCCFE